MKMRKWVVAFYVADTWIRDGFDLTDERAKEMLAHDLDFARDDELKARVISAPAKGVIRDLQSGKLPVAGES